VHAQLRRVADEHARLVVLEHALEEKPGAAVKHVSKLKLANHGVEAGGALNLSSRAARPVSRPEIQV
jgi:hypothetical protein